MKICCVSDTHCHPLIKFPEADLLVISGDFTMNGTEGEFELFNDQCKQIIDKYKYGIYACPGNHDFLAQRNRHLAEDILTHCNLLIDEAVTIENLNFYFSPWTPWFFDWAFNFEEQNTEQANRCWAGIPDDTHVLITHGPPRKIRDHTPDHYNHMGRNVGCGALFNRIQKLPNLLLHTFGHIHADRGVLIRPNIKNTTIFCNASICNEQYQPINKPYVIDINSLTKETDLIEE